MTGPRLSPDERAVRALWVEACDVLRDSVPDVMPHVREGRPAQVMGGLDWPGFEAVLTVGLAALLARIADDAGAATFPHPVGKAARGPDGRLTGDAAAAFRRADPRVIAWAESRCSGRFPEIAGPLKDSVRQVVVDGLRNGHTARHMGRVIEAMIGTPDRARASALAAKDANLREFLGAGDTQRVAEERAEKVFEAVCDKLVKLRGETVARTEVIAAQNGGTQLAWGQAAEQGVLDMRSLKEWNASDPCPICDNLDGTQVPWDGGFDAAGESLSQPPAHPNCRCTTLLIAPEDAKAGGL